MAPESEAPIGLTLPWEAIISNETAPRWAMLVAHAGSCPVHTSRAVDRLAPVPLYALDIDTDGANAFPHSSGVRATPFGVRCNVVNFGILASLSEDLPRDSHLSFHGAMETYLPFSA